MIHVFSTGETMESVLRKYGLDAITTHSCTLPKGRIYYFLHNKDEEFQRWLIATYDASPVEYPGAPPGTPRLSVFAWFQFEKDARRYWWAIAEAAG